MATGAWDTALSPDEEPRYQKWKERYAPDDSGADYDLRGAFKANVTPDPASGHWPDTYKKPNHPTFSDESVYAKQGNPGKWESGKYVPGKNILAGFRAKAAATNKGVDPYSDMSDDQLAEGMHRRYYSDVPFDEYAKKIGFTPTAKQVARPDSIPDEAPVSRTQRIMDAAKNMAGAAIDPQFWQGMGDSLAKMGKSVVTGEPVINLNRDKEALGETLGARMEKKVVGTQEFQEERGRNEARKTIGQSVYLPRLIQEAKAKGIPLDQHPEIADIAKSYGSTVDEFTMDRDLYSGEDVPGMPKVDVGKRYRAARQRLIDANDSLAELAQRRIKAGEAINAARPKDMDDWSARALLFDAASSVPDLLASVGAGIATGPVGGLAVLAGTVAPEFYADAKNDGANHEKASTYSALMTLAEVAPELPFAHAIAGTPQGKAIMKKLVGKAVDSTGGKIAGEAALEGVSEGITSLLQSGIDAGVLDKSMTLKDVLTNAARDTLIGAGMGGGIGGAVEISRAKGVKWPTREEQLAEAEALARRAAPDLVAPEPLKQITGPGPETDFEVGAEGTARQPGEVDKDALRLPSREPPLEPPPPRGPNDFEVGGEGVARRPGERLTDLPALPAPGATGEFISGPEGTRGRTHNELNARDAALAEERERNEELGLDNKTRVPAPSFNYKGDEKLEELPKSASSRRAVHQKKVEELHDAITEVVDPKEVTLKKDGDSFVITVRGKPIVSFGSRVLADRELVEIRKDIANRHAGQKEEGFYIPRSKRGIPEPESTAVVLGQEIETPATPTPAQATAGNYKKPPVKWNGIDIKVENVKDSTRSGVDKEGKPWASKMHSDYGYFAGTKSTDGEGVDVYMGPHRGVKTAYVVDQLTPDGLSFDEPKVIIGAKSEDAAKSLYLKHYPKGWKGLGSITPMPVEGLKAWLRSGNTQSSISWSPPAPKAPKPPSRSTHAPQAKHDSILEYLSKTKLHGADTVGLNLDALASEGLDPSEMASARGHGINKPFTRYGGSLDHAAEILTEAGFPVGGDKNKLLDLITDEIRNGKKTYAGEKSFDELDEELRKKYEEPDVDQEELSALEARVERMAKNMEVNEKKPGYKRDYSQKYLDKIANQIAEKHGLESLTLYGHSNGDLYLQDIGVKKGERKQGRGTAAMKDVTRFADSIGKRITLTPGIRDGNGTTSRARLESFYKRFGFVQNKGRNKDFSLSESMYRNPSSAVEEPSTAYHGSSARFKKFVLDDSTVGKGEGAQSYGWGLYFAESSAVADSYRRNVTHKKSYRTGGRDLLEIMDGFVSRGMYEHADLAERILMHHDRERLLRYAEEAGLSKAAVSWLKSLPKTLFAKPGGALYTVTIDDASLDKMVDLDKPYARQTDEVKDAFAEERRADARAGMMDLYRMLARRLDSDKTASLYLKDRGIPGIKYLDEMSRSGKKSTRNFVLFDESLVEITHEDGNEIKDRRHAYAGQMMLPFDREQPKAIAKIETRPNTTGRQVRLGKAAFQSILTIRDVRSGAALLASGIPKDFVHEGTVSLLGRTVKTADDLAELAQVYRDPRFETLRVVYVRGDKVVHQTGISSRLPGSVKFKFGEEDTWSASMSALRQMMLKSKATGYYMLHNHPSGNPIPSSADEVVSWRSAQDMAGFLGHVVIDNGAYSVISMEDGDTVTTTKNHNFGGYVSGENPELDHPVLHAGIKVTGPKQLAIIAKAVEGAPGMVTVIGITGSNSAVRAIAQFPVSMMNGDMRSLARIRRFAINSGSRSLFAVVDNINDVKRFAKKGLFTDIAFKSSGGGGYESYRGSRLENHEDSPDEDKAIISENIGRRVAKTLKVDEPAGEYQTDSKEFKRWFGNSKVVDGNGAPLVVYHGTVSGFEEFDKAHLGKVTGSSDSKVGFWFTSDREHAREFASEAKHLADDDMLDAEILETYLKIENPFVVDDIQDLVPSDVAKIARKAKKGGHDGIIFTRGEKGLGSNYLVFEPTQIKSATDNSGEYDPTDPSIVREPPPEYRAEAMERAKVAPESERGRGYAALANKVIDVWNKKVGNRYGALGALPEAKKYLIERYKTLGGLTHVREITRGIFTALNKASDTDKEAIYAYLTTRGATPDSIVDTHVRDTARKVKEAIDEQGKLLVETGLLSEESYEAYRDQYLPRLYLRHILDDGQRGRTMGSGKKLSDMGYLKKRKDIPKEVRDVILGEITDPAFLAAFGLSKTMRDVQIMNFLGNISKNESWAPNVMMVEFDGRRVSPYWLQAEARQLRKQADHIKNALVAGKARAIADRMDSMANAAMAKLGEVDLKDYKQIPDSPRYGAMRGLYVRKEIHEDLVGAHQFVEAGSLLENVFGQQGLIAKSTRGWKMSKVALNVPSHFRNMMGNAIMMHLSGVNMAMIPVRYAQAIDSLISKDKYYDIAVKYGLKEATFANTELYRIRDEWVMLQKTKKPLLNKLHAMFAAGIEKVGDVYQFEEALSKIAKLRDELEKGSSEADSMIEAHKWLFDYSLVPRTVRYLRNAPFGAPFLSYTYFVIPRLLEVAVRRPWKYLPWMAVGYGMAEAIKQMFGADDDDLDKLKKSYPNWMENKGSMMLMPWQDKAGRWQLVDMGYITPWGQMADSMTAFGAGNPGAALEGMGVMSGPIPDIIAAFKTGIDPFTKRAVADPGDPPWKQAGAVFDYAYSMAAPGFLTRQGALGKVKDYYTGHVDPKSGEPTLTEAQAWLRLFGVSVYPFDPEATRSKNLRSMQFEIDEVRQRMGTQLRDRNLSETQKEEIRRVYEEEIKRRVKVKQKYESESAVPDSLKRKQDDLTSRIGVLIDGKNKDEAVRSLRDAGHPALAALFADMPAKPRPTVAKALQQEARLS